MFNIFKVKKLEAQIESLKADLKRAREAANRDVMEDCHGSDFVIDWDNLDAFSVERHGGPKTAYTIIGYYVHNADNTKTVDEWKFFCSQEQHNQLAEEFRNGIAKKNNSAVR